MHFVCFNGNLLPAGQPLFTADNRSFRYGDGIFETIKVKEGRICLAGYHFDRLLSSLRLLKMQLPDNFSLVLQQQIVDLCRLNNCSQLARVRLAVYRTDAAADYVIEAWPLAADKNQWSNKGYAIDIYPDGRKSTDAFANLKTANYLIYVLANMYAQENNLDDCIVLNSYNHIADASKANVFLVQKDIVYTPALHQGCVSGVMRRHIIQVLKEMHYTVLQTEVTEALLYQAGEVFLTNAIYGIRWVSTFRQKEYGSAATAAIYQYAFTNRQY